MKNENTNDLRKDFPMADSYLDSLALAGKIPKCTYPNNGVPKLRKNPKQVSAADLLTFVGKRG